MRRQMKMVEPGTARILVVDDDPDIAELLYRHLLSGGYSCTKALSGEDAVTLLEKGETFDLILSDIMMPGMSGIDLLTFVRALFPDTAVIMVTGVVDRKTAITALEIGAYGYVLKPFDREEILINVASALERHRVAVLSKEYESALESKVRQRTKEVRDREEQIVLRLLSASEHRDDETGLHIRRVGLYAAEMARSLGWGSESVADIRLAASMHDVGKIGIPDRILRKPGGFTPDEFEMMKQHTVIGATILDGTDVPLLQMAKEIALCHHERADGSGYPRGLHEAAIPQSALIVGIVDFYDALVHDRVYRPRLSEDKALSIMLAGNGEYFGNEIFECFMSLLPVLQCIRKENQETGERQTLSNQSNNSRLHRLWVLEPRIAS
jgi:putative two-component system response regulator